MEGFNRSIKNLLKKLVFEKIDGNWKDILPTIKNQYIIQVHTCTK